MTSITLSFFGPPEQKHACKITAMQTLSDALQSVSTKFKPPLQPDQCELHLNKKAVDLRTPFRLLNVPAGSKLEIFKKAAAPAAAPAATAAASPAQTPTTAVPTTSEATAARSVAEEAAEPKPLEVPPAATAPGTTPAALQQAEAASAPEAATTVAPRQVTFEVAESAPAQAVAATVQPSSLSPAVAAAPGGSSSNTTISEASPALAALGLTVPVFVFHQRVLEEAAATAPSAMDIDPPDEFFELTAEDLQRLQHQANQKKKAESVFRTRAAREAEEPSRAASMAPVRVRLHFPDGTLLQAAFKATDPLSQVQDLLHKCATPELATALYLYTTPPKTVLKDSSASLYSLQLVPAAHIYVGMDEKKLQHKTDATPPAGSFLRAEVQALMQNTVPEPAQATEHRQEQQAGTDSNSAEAVAAAQRAVRLAAAASRQAGAGGSAAGGGAKVPKWFKK